MVELGIAETALSVDVAITVAEVGILDQDLYNDVVLTLTVVFSVQTAYFEKDKCWKEFVQMIPKDAIG